MSPDFASLLVLLTAFGNFALSSPEEKSAGLSDTAGVSLTEIANEEGLQSSVNSHNAVYTENSSAENEVWLDKDKNIEYLGSETQGSWAHAIEKFNNKIWNSVYGSWVDFTAHNCAESHGQIFNMYYRYWGGGENCNVVVSEEIIKSAIQASLTIFGDRWNSEDYCITLSQDGEWQGTLLVGHNSSVKTSTCNRKFEGDFDVGSKLFKQKD